MRILFTITAALALTVTLSFPQETPKKIQKVSAVYTNPGDGPEMYRNYCAACHGTDATGNGPAASALKKAPADLTALSKKHNGKFPKLEVQQFIRGDSSPEAHGTRDMPMWGDIFRSIGTNQQALAEMRVRNLATFIESLQK